MTKSNKPMKVLGGLTIEEFFRDYWQKKPLFVKNAFQDFVDPMSPDEIAGLSCEDGVPSRFVFEERNWELKCGPFADKDFANLPEKKWVLLVNDVEKFMPQMRVLSDPFNFIPEWRMDDLQVSYAVDQGTVGAHWDDYDVFLIQGMGKKKWQISYDEVSENDFVAGLPIRLIEKFNVHEEWIVEPGDLLYLPPRIGHFGVAIGESMTWSVGFRAPKHREMIHDFVEDIIQFTGADERYSDADLLPRELSTELNDDDIDRVMKVIQEGLSNNRDLVADWFGRFMSECKEGQEPETLDEEFSTDEVQGLLEDGADIERVPTVSLYFRETVDEVVMYANGECFALDKKHTKLVQFLCENRQYSPGKMLQFMKDEVAAEFVVDLVNQGILAFFDGDDHDHECDGDCDHDH